MHPAVLHSIARTLAFQATQGSWIRKEYGTLFRPIDLEILGWDVSVFRDELPALPDAGVLIRVFQILAPLIPPESIPYFRPASLSFTLTWLSKESQLQLAEIFERYYT